MLMSQQEEAKSYTFLAPNGVTQMGKKTRLIRLREEDWANVEPFLRKPTFVTLKEALPPQ